MLSLLLVATASALPRTADASEVGGPAPSSKPRLLASSGKANSEERDETPASENGLYRGRLLEMTGDERRPVNVWNRNGEPVFEPYYVFERKGLALIGRDYALRLEGGRFFSAGAEEHLGGGLKNAEGELTLCAYIHPASVNQKGTGCIIGYGPSRGRTLFALKQQASDLIFEIRATDFRSIRLLKLNSTKPFHLVLVLAKDGITFFREGKKAGTRPGLNGTFNARKEGILVFGSDPRGAQPWRGQIERVSLFSRALSSNSAAKVANEVLEEVRDRGEEPRIAFRGTLLARSKYPMPWKKGFTYREVLSICEYKVNKVLGGEFEEKKIRVAEWMYVDRTFLTNSRKKIGSEYELTVERLDVNAHLSTVQRCDTLDLDIDAEVHYDLSPIQALPPNEQPRPARKK